MAENAIVPYEINALTKVSKKKKKKRETKQKRPFLWWFGLKDIWRSVYMKTCYCLYQSFFNINSTSIAWILGDALVYLSHKNSTEL